MSIIHTSLAWLKEFDDDSVILLIDGAYSYFLDPKSYPIKKLTAGARAPFSAIYTLFKKAGVKVYQDIIESNLSKAVKAHLKDKVRGLLFLEWIMTFL